MESEWITIDIPHWDYSLGQRPRNLRTPSSDAGECLRELDDLWVRVEGKSPGFVVYEMYSLIAHADYDPDTLIGELRVLAQKIYESASGECPETTPFFEMSKVVGAFCNFAMRYEYSGNQDLAWSYSSDALVWLEKLVLYSASLSESDGKKATAELKWRSYDFSSLGKQGSDIRHAPMRELQRWAVTRDQMTKTANQVAHDLKEVVIAHGRTIGATLEPQNAQRTIAEWLRKSRKSL